MTGNQISYQRFLEDQRHNLAYEANQARQIAELERHNLVSESQGWRSILETERHNQVGESISWANLNELIRHNQAGENISWFNAYENKRHNLAGENIGWYNAFEAHRHNVAGEQYNLSYLNELARHNRESEYIDWNRANTMYASYAEDVRHNKAYENIQRASRPWSYLFDPQATSELGSNYISMVDSGNSIGSSMGSTSVGSWLWNIENKIRSWFGAPAGNSQDYFITD